MSRSKPIFSKENEGRLYFKPGEEIPYRLVRFGEVVIQRVDELQPRPAMSLEDVSGLRLIPDTLIGKPEAPKKLRADAGKNHKRKANQELYPSVLDGEGVIAEGVNNG